jgi:hypothetical protein
MYKKIHHEVHKSTAALRLSKLGSLELNIAKKNLANLNGLKAIQFALVFYDQGAIYLLIEIYDQITQILNRDGFQNWQNGATLFVNGPLLLKNNFLCYNGTNTVLLFVESVNKQPSKE